MQNEERKEKNEAIEVMAFTLLGFSLNNGMKLSLNSPSAISHFQPFMQCTNMNLRMREIHFNRVKSFTVTRMRSPICYCSSDSATSATPYTFTAGVPRMIRKRRRYRKMYPGEKEGIAEEMRFVAMKLRNVKGKKIVKEEEEANDGVESTESLSSSGVNDDDDGETWQPSLEGFLKYLVDSQLVFNTVERIVDESSDVSYVYFRKTGLERSEALSEDLEWFREQEIEIPEASSPGISYAKYLEQLAEASPPLFLSHLYNIYFAHIAGGQVIAKKVSKKILEGRELKFVGWEKGEEEECLKGVREKMNMLGEHWSRDDKTKCLREATKCFQYQGQIIRHIIL